MASNVNLTFYNGQTMPILGLGTWQSSPDEIDLAIKTAIDVGYRHFDTAYLYSNEEAIGKTFTEIFKSGKVKREDVFITTKLPAHGMRRDLVKHFMQKSLKSLQMDYVDLYLIHSPMGTKYIDDETAFSKDEDGNLVFDMDTNHQELWKGMEELVDAGLAKSIGISNFNIKQIQRILNTCRIKPANLQVECHVYFQQTELVQFCKSNGITVVAYGPIGSPGKKVMDEKRGIKAEYVDLLGDPAIIEFGKKYNKSPAQILLRFLIQCNISVIPKSINPKRIRENFDVFDFEINEEDMKKLKSMNRNYRMFQFDFFKNKDKLHPEWPFE